MAKSLIPYGFVLWISCALAGGTSCPEPEAGVNTRVETSSLSPGSVAKYSCDPGYELFGTSERTCSESGTWLDKPPMCATNVAWRKPVNQSSTARGGEARNANDGDLTTVHDGNKCSQTISEESPWWSVDLLQEYEISLLKITTKGSGEHKIQDLEIRVGDSFSLQRNRLCTWYPGVLEPGVTKELKCARKMRARFVFIQMVGIKGALSMCEVEVFSTEVLSKDRCKGDLDVSKLSLFNETCYEFQTTSGGSYEVGRAYCQKRRGGDLIHGITDMAHHFVVEELKRFQAELKTKLLWIGAQKDKGFIERTWRWIDGEKVNSPPWGKEQPNNYNGEQNCVVLDGGREWKWNDIGCDLNYLYWICQFQPSCGTPDKNENTTVITTQNGLDSSAKYDCPIGNKVTGDRERTCLINGRWSGAAPTCKYIDCGTPDNIENGFLSLVNNRTTFSAKVSYDCSENYTIKDADTLTCTESGKWEPAYPECLYSWCPELTSPKYGKVDISGRRSGDTAVFHCDNGYTVIGEKTISCTLGGHWSSSVPTCRFVDCGVPQNVEYGKITLTNGTTYLDSKASYKCHDDYILEGLETRVCEPNGYWTGSKPICKPINCGEPKIPVGGFVTGYSFDVHSKVEYHCEKGHQISGDQERICTRNSSWSGATPTCTFVDCGRLPAVVKGEMKYLSGKDETFLNSEVEFSCSPNYKLSGSKKRICEKNGQWSGQQPNCDEIRCSQPSHPIKSRITISGGDRRPTLAFTRQSSQMKPGETFRVGTKMTYRCDRGHVTNGSNTIHCRRDGSWSHEAPTCQHIDCKLPSDVTMGKYRLLSNETSYGAVAAYECGSDYRVKGNHRRQCLANGSWSGPDPMCVEVLCPSIEDQLQKRYKSEDEKVIEPWKIELIAKMEAMKLTRLMVEDGTRRVGTNAAYKCRKGQKIVGEAIIICKKHGIWEGGEPKCEWVYCSKPQELLNGRVHLLTKDTRYGAVVEHFCLPKHRLIGTFNRTCTQSGLWSGADPSCTFDDSYHVSLDGNAIDGYNLAHGTPEDRAKEGSYTGIYVGIIVSLMIIAGMVMAIAILRKRVENPKPASVTLPKNTDIPNPAVLTYGDLNDPTSGENNIYEQIPEDFENSFTNMTPTSSFSSSPVGSYTNYSNHAYSNTGDVGGPTYSNDTDSYMDTSRRRDRPPYPISQRPRMPPPAPPQDPTGAPSTAEPTTVTINGVAVRTSRT